MSKNRQAAYSGIKIFYFVGSGLSRKRGEVRTHLFYVGGAVK